jgi:hypothetical protein
MLVVLSLFAVVGAAVVLSVPGQRGPARANLDLLALKARLDAAVRRTLVRGEPFAIWQGEGDLVVLIMVDEGRWEAARDPRINPAKLISRHPRMSFQRDHDDVFSVSPALVPERGERLRISLGDDSDAYFDGLNLVLAQSERQDAEAEARRRVQPD